MGSYLPCLGQLDHVRHLSEGSSFHGGVSRDGDRSQLWSYLCARRLVGDRRTDLERS